VTSKAKYGYTLLFISRMDGKDKTNSLENAKSRSKKIAVEKTNEMSEP
jgi:hypothetical protein